MSNLKTPTAEQKIAIASELVSTFKAQCEKHCVFEDKEAMVLALYAATNSSEREALLMAGIK